MHRWSIAFSYRGKAIDQRCITMAKALLWRLGDGWDPCPCSDGSISMEYNADGMTLTLDVDVSSER
jgi:hypothetical protein